MRWPDPEEIEHGQGTTVQDRSARHAATVQGQNVDDMVMQAWEKRQRQIAEQEARREARAQGIEGGE